MLNRADSINEDFNSVITKADNYKCAGSQRIYIWEKAFGIIPYKPLVGSGPDTFDLEVKKVYGYFIYDGGIDRE
jgi:O-antigen ligase